MTSFDDTQRLNFLSETQSAVAWSKYIVQVIVAGKGSIIAYHNKPDGADENFPVFEKSDALRKALDSAIDYGRNCKATYSTALIVQKDESTLEENKNE